MALSENLDIENWLNVFGRLNLDVPPVGVTFSSHPMEGIQKFEKKMNLCQMLKEAQNGDAFCAGPDNHDCSGGRYIMGKKLPYEYTIGEYGAGLQVYDSPRAGRRVYDQIPRLESDRSIDYVSFAPLPRLNFNPDLLVMLANIDQAEVLLRALSFSNGKKWSSYCTGVIGCAWIFMYPYISGEANYVVTGLSMGMRAFRLFPPGWLLISIPNDLLPMMVNNLSQIPLTLPIFLPDGQEFRRNLLSKLGLDPTH